MRVLAAGFAISFGLLVLLGYIFPVGILLQIRFLLVHWAIILAAIAIIVGAINLIGAHWKKIHTGQKGSPYSALLILTLVISALFGIILGPQSAYMRVILDAIIVPVEAALMALLAVTLVYASIRLLRYRADLMTILFLAVAVFSLLAAAPLPFGKIPFLSEIQFWLTQTFAMGGARGLLLGIALGALTTGLRVLFGMDRPYGGK